MARTDSIIIRVSRFNYFAFYLLAGLLFAAVAWLAYNQSAQAITLALISAAAVAITAVLELLVFTTTLILSHTGVAHETGVLSKHRTALHYSKISDVTVDQSVVQRLLGIGNLDVNTAGSEKKEISFKNIQKAKKVHDFIIKRLHQHQAYKYSAR